MTFSIMTFSITTLSTVTHSIMGFIATLSVYDIQHETFSISILLMLNFRKYSA